MAPAILDTVVVLVEAGDYIFRASGSTIKFPGFMTLYIENTDNGEQTDEDGMLPDRPRRASQAFGTNAQSAFHTAAAQILRGDVGQDPRRVGIGRPSTYAQIIDTIKRRGYVTVEDKRFSPTDQLHSGRAATEHFPNIIDVEFTAKMENRLDQVEEGGTDWVELLEEFWRPFEADLKKAEVLMEEVEIADEESDEVCEKCGRRMVIKQGRYGRFLACPGFPECRNTKPLLKEIGVACPVCQGQVVERKTRRGRTFTDAPTILR